MKLFWIVRRWRLIVPAVVLLVIVALLAGTRAVQSQNRRQGRNLASLKTVEVPVPSNFDAYVRDSGQLVALGKALFWDMQVGSDGRTACATCHFHAGADHRIWNQVEDPSGSFAAGERLTPNDFPVHLLEDPDDRRSSVVRDAPAVVGSAGVRQRHLAAVVPGSRFDAAQSPSDDIGLRQVTGRNTPSVINSVFNFRNFWDGRASDIFTGRTPFGDSDDGIHSVVEREGRLVAERVWLDNSSLASQAVGPPVNTIEMSYTGRTWPELGKKMLSLRPLAMQRVAADDSVLGGLSNPGARGLDRSISYLTMVRAAFRTEYWGSTELVDADGRPLGRTTPVQGTDDFTQAEFNFAIFWGIAIQAYEATLVSDDSRYDRFAEGARDALTREEQRGLRLFNGRSDCNDCHRGAEFTEASFTRIDQRGVTERVGRGRRRGNRGAIGERDTGFARIGVRPIAEDLGLAGDDDFGNRISIAATEDVSADRLVQGAFKVPGLRNVELTGPYFHNGGQATLDQVVSFYGRGGDFRTAGFASEIRRRNLDEDDRQALVAFLESLTDDRVLFERAPFDHPELCVPVDSSESDQIELWAAIPAVGRSGNLAPLQTFSELLAGVGDDSSRTHTLTIPCDIP